MNNNVEIKNKQLREVQRIWCKQVLENYVEKYTKNGFFDADKDSGDKNGYEVSCPFCMGLTDEYINNVDKKKVMIIGQQPLGFGCWEENAEDFYLEDSQNKFSHSISQKWSNDYLNKQLHPEIDNGQDYNRSPFWSIFRKLQHDFALCWNDIDKVYYGKKEENYFSGALTYLAEEKLSCKFDFAGKSKSLIEREIEIAEPDIVLFVTGPYYALSIATALGYENFTRQEIDGKSPNKENPLVQLDNIKTQTKNIQVFWTYHPNYLLRSKTMDKVVEDLKKCIK